MAAADPDEIEAILLSRCAMCHAAEPYWDGIVVPPKNVILEDAADFARYAEKIYLQAAHSRAMPPGNVTLIEPRERQILAAWYETQLAAP